MLGVGACFGGELRKLRFLIRCDLTSIFKIGQSWCQATGEEKARMMLIYTMALLKSTSQAARYGASLVSLK